MNLVERLRKPREILNGLPVGECYGCYDLERKEAADEIERLRTELRNLQHDMDRAMLNHANDLTQ